LNLCPSTKTEHLAHIKDILTNPEVGVHTSKSYWQTQLLNSIL